MATVQTSIIYEQARSARGVNLIEIELPAAMADNHAPALGVVS
jgi:hypothetical protein